MQCYTAYLYLETALLVSGGTSTQHQERIQLYLQHHCILLDIYWNTLTMHGPINFNLLIILANDRWGLIRRLNG
jgi:hypothetical protein